MKIQPKVRNTVLVGALAAVAATAWANHDVITNSTYIPTPYVAVEESGAELISERLAVSESLSPNETVVVADEAVAASDARPVAVADRSITQPGITVQDRRLSEDERIQSLVMDRLATSRNISGKVGVESHDAVVKLSGYTLTAGQAYRAGREAGSIVGVKHVQNEIRPRIGGSV